MGQGSLLPKAQGHDKFGLVCKKDVGIFTDLASGAAMSVNPSQEQLEETGTEIERAATEKIIMLEKVRKH